MLACEEKPPSEPALVADEERTPTSSKNDWTDAGDLAKSTESAPMSAMRLILHAAEQREDSADIEDEEAEKSDHNSQPSSADDDDLSHATSVTASTVDKLQSWANDASSEAATSKDASEDGGEQKLVMHRSACQQCHLRKVRCVRDVGQLSCAQCIRRKEDCIPCDKRSRTRRARLPSLLSKQPKKRQAVGLGILNTIEGSATGHAPASSSAAPLACRGEWNCLTKANVQTVDVQSARIGLMSRLGWRNGLPSNGAAGSLSALGAEASLAAAQWMNSALPTYSASPSCSASLADSASLAGSFNTAATAACALPSPLLQTSDLASCASCRPEPSDPSAAHTAPASAGLPPHPWHAMSNGAQWAHCGATPNLNGMPGAQPLGADAFGSNFSFGWPCGSFGPPQMFHRNSAGAMPFGVGNGMGNGVHNGVGNGVHNGVGNGMANGNGVDNGVGNGVNIGMGNGVNNGVGLGNGVNNGVGNGMGNGNGVNNGMGTGVNNGMGTGVNNGMGNGVNNGDGMGNGVNNGVGNGMGNGNVVSHGMCNGVNNGMGNCVGNGMGNGVSNGMAIGVKNGMGNGVNNSVGNGMGNGAGNGVGNGMGNGMGNGVNGMGNGVNNGAGNGVNNGVCTGVGNGMGTGMGNGIGNSASCAAGTGMCSDNCNDLMKAMSGSSMSSSMGDFKTIGQPSAGMGHCHGYSMGACGLAQTSADCSFAAAAQQQMWQRQPIDQAQLLAKQHSMPQPPMFAQQQQQQQLYGGHMHGAPFDIKDQMAMMMMGQHGQPFNFQQNQQVTMPPGMQQEMFQRMQFQMQQEMQQRMQQSMRMNMMQGMHPAQYAAGH